MRRHKMHKKKKKKINFADDKKSSSHSPRTEAEKRLDTTGERVKIKRLAKRDKTCRLAAPWASPTKAVTVGGPRHKLNKGTVNNAPKTAAGQRARRACWLHEICKERSDAGNGASVLFYFISFSQTRLTCPLPLPGNDLHFPHELDVLQIFNTVKLWNSYAWEQGVSCPQNKVIIIPKTFKQNFPHGYFTNITEKWNYKIAHIH